MLLDFGGGLDFPHPSRPASGSCTMGTGSFPGGKAAGAWHSSNTPFYPYLKITPPFSTLLSYYSASYNKLNQTTKCTATTILTYDTIGTLLENQLHNISFLLSLFLVLHYMVRNIFPNRKKNFYLPRHCYKQLRFPHKRGHWLMRLSASRVTFSQ